MHISIVLSMLFIFKTHPQARGVCDYLYPACKLTISDTSALEVSAVAACGMPGGAGVRSAVRTRHCAGGRCTYCVVSPPCLSILCGAILGSKVARHLVMIKHCRVSLYCSLPLSMPSKLNPPLLLFSDLGGWYLYEIFGFLNCGA
jgi:hypothetical protein